MALEEPLPPQVHQIGEALRRLHDAALELYTAQVEAVLAGSIRSPWEIEAILDGLMDFGADDRFRALYQKLCRRIYPQYPTMVAEHVLLWRSIHDPEAQAAQQENQPPAD